MDITNKYFYSYGLPFSQELGYRVDQQIERIENRRASCILIDGAIGLGKTTLATELMDYINKKKGLPEVSFNIKEHTQIALGGKEFVGNFRKCHSLGLPVITYDEAGDFSRRGAITEFNLMLNNVFQTYRGFKILVIICLPNLNVLDNQIFDNQIPRLLIHLKERTANQGSFDVHSLANINWIRHYFDKLPKGCRNKCYSLVMPNLYGHFKNLPPEREKALDKLSTHGKMDLLKQTEIDLKGLLTIPELGEKLGKSIIYIRKKLAEYKIKPKTTMGRKNYYNKEALAILLSNIKERRIDEK